MRRLDRLVERAHRLPPLAVDGAIGAGIFALAGLGQLQAHALHPTVLGLYVIASLGVALRRKSLWIGCALVLLAHLGGLIVTGDFIALAVMVMIYTVAELRGLGASLVALIVSFVLPFIGWHQVFYRHWGWLDVSAFAHSIYPYLVMVWFAGRAQARRRDIATQLESRVAQLQEERARLSQAAIDAERSRIARDLHALVVQGVQRMNAEARSARELLGTGSAQGPDSVRAIESAGRATLADMRRLLMVLRTRDGPAASRPDVEKGSERLSMSSASKGSTVNVARAEPTRPSADGALRIRAQRMIAGPWVADALLVLALASLAATEPVLVPITAYSVPVWPFAAFASIAIAVLLLRRRFPLTVLAFVAIVAFVYYAFFDFNQAPLYTVDRSVFVAVFTVAAFRGLPWGITAVGVVAIAYIPPFFITKYFNGPLDLIFWSAVYLFAVAGGVGARNAQRLNAGLQDQTELLRRTREERIRLAVLEERTRVARDLHDVVAHALTVMVVQAGAARALAAKKPGRARAALAAVDHAGHEAIAELDSLLGHLGLAGVDTVQLLFEPEERSVASLVDQAVKAGVRIELLTDGQPLPLGAGLELAVYRIVQEALTNVRKHASEARAWVEVRYRADVVEIEVTDTGPTTVASAEAVPGAGLGLVGIAERAALFGGTSEAGPTAQGGFRVRARLQRETVLV